MIIFGPPPVPVEELTLRSEIEEFWRLEASLDVDNRESMIHCFVRDHGWNPFYSDYDFKPL